MPQVLNEVDVSSASVVGVVTPAVMPSWPEFGLRAVFRLSQGAATIRLKGDGHIIHEFALPIVSGNKLGERQKDMLIPGLYSTWSWELVSISGGGVVYCRATAAAEDTPVTMEHLSFASLLSSLQAKMARDLVEGTGTDVAFQRIDSLYNSKYVLDAGVGLVLPVMRVTANPATDVIAAQRITAGGTAVRTTDIDGNAVGVGTVIHIQGGAVNLTSIYVGSSLGVSQTLSADETVTVDELGKWTCLEADNCSDAFIYFGPPRSSGRLCDVTVIGKRRTS